MIRLKSTNCIDCIRVTEHLISEYMGRQRYFSVTSNSLLIILGLNDYKIDAKVGSLTFSLPLGTVQISEVASLLKNSGIESFPIGEVKLKKTSYVCDRKICY